MNYDFKEVRKKLGKYGDVSKEKGREYLIINGKKIPIPRTTSTNKISEDDLYSLAEKLDKKNAKKLFKEFTDEPPKGKFGRSLDKIINYKPEFATAIFGVALLFFVAVRTNLTGFVLGNFTNSTTNIMSNSTANWGIIICIIGLIGLLYHRHRCRCK